MESLRVDNSLKQSQNSRNCITYDYSFITEKHTNQNWTKEETLWEKLGTGVSKLGASVSSVTHCPPASMHGSTYMQHHQLRKLTWAALSSVSVGFYCLGIIEPLSTWLNSISTSFLSLEGKLIAYGLKLQLQAHGYLCDVASQYPESSCWHNKRATTSYLGNITQVCH